MSCDTWAPHLVFSYVISMYVVSTWTDACSNSGPALGCARMPLIEPAWAPLTGHLAVTVGHGLTADPVLGSGVERTGGLSEVACMLILSPILPSWVLNGLGLSFPTCEQMNLLVITSDPCEINKAIRSTDKQRAYCYDHWGS